MPVGKKTTWAQLRVGLLAISALVLLAVLVMLLSGENPLFRTSQPVYTYYGDAAAVTEGAPVRLNGILVGKVGAVELSNEPDPTRVVRVTLEIDEEFLPSIPDDSETRLAQTSLLSARYVNINKGMSPMPVQPRGELRSRSDAALEDLFQQGNTTLAALQTILVRVERIVSEIEDGKGSIGRFIRDPRFYDGLVGVVDETKKLVTAFNNPNSTLGKVIYEDQLYNDIRGMIGRVNTLLENVDRDLSSGQGTLSKLLKDPAMHDQLMALMGDLRETIRLINSGDGTVAKLLNDPTLHTRIEALLNSMDQLLGHINSGEGTLGQLVLNPQLYENIDGLTSEMNALMRDFRANPKKFLTIRLTLF